MRPFNLLTDTLGPAEAELAGATFGSRGRRGGSLAPLPDASPALAAAHSPLHNPLHRPYSPEPPPAGMASGLMIKRQPFRPVFREQQSRMDYGGPAMRSSRSHGSYFARQCYCPIPGSGHDHLGFVQPRLLRSAQDNGTATQRSMSLSRLPLPPPVVSPVASPWTPRMTHLIARGPTSPTPLTPVQASDATSGSRPQSGLKLRQQIFGDGAEDPRAMWPHSWNHDVQPRGKHR